MAWDGMGDFPWNEWIKACKFLSRWLQCLQGVEKFWQKRRNRIKESGPCQDISSQRNLQVQEILVQFQSCSLGLLHFPTSSVCFLSSVLAHLWVLEKLSECESELFIALFWRRQCSHFACQLLLLRNQKIKWMFSKLSVPFIWFVIWGEKKPYENCKKCIKWMLHPSQFSKCFWSWWWFNNVIENDGALSAITQELLYQALRNASSLIYLILVQWIWLEAKLFLCQVWVF